MIEQQLHMPYIDIAKSVSASIAPAWPLDQSIAVNPWWPQRHNSIETTFAEQTVITGETSLMPRAYYRELWNQQIQPEHMHQAIAQSDSVLTYEQVIEDLQRNEPSLIRWKTLAMLMDEEIPSEQGHSWAQEIVQQVSQFIALYHQYPDRFDADGKDGEHLYQSWLEVICRDKGMKTLLGVDLLPYFQKLPKSLLEALGAIYEIWQPTWQTESGCRAFMRASLQQLSGWAGWQSWLDWQANLAQKPSSLSHTLGLTTILLAWDKVLMMWLEETHPQTAKRIRQTLGHQTNNIEQLYCLAKQQLAPMWIWQRALELSVQNSWIHQVSSVKESTESARPQLQAVFCIDVRSEPMRRALEAQGSDIETVGFAGFFGIPIAYQNHDGSILRPQLPGLLAPDLVAQQTRMQPERWLRLTKLGWQNSLDKPSSNLGMVEAGGLIKLVSLFKRVVMQEGTENPVNKDLRANETWQLKRNQTLLTTAEKAELGAGILTAMGIAKRLANVVLLTGHGSQTCNNHTSSSLDCGACGGQSGEVNVKVLASLLNDEQVRREMENFGVNIPADTQFYAALHNTTTDNLTVFDAPSANWRKTIIDASHLARHVRAEQFDAPVAPSKSDLNRFFKQRATNWAQMRPEWGLCNNAGVFIAPRTLTRNLDFAGRAFLHEYHSEQDPEYVQLEKILTAPLLVMNWINLQYYASVTTPEKFGSGNKLLHNVVGGHIGVFEGNGGDLRIGLSKQSVHDGSHYRHQPVRLSVFIQAPQLAIEAIMAQHQDVASLVNNGWLFLYHVDSQKQVSQYRDGTWQVIT
nr:putative inorganic carbon transporter subunit DabA [uncultured Vibrio sp.]